MKRSNRFVVTLKSDNSNHDQLLNELRSITKVFNRLSGFSFRIQKVGRLGKNNPNAIKYKNNSYMNYRPYSKIRVGDASRFDIYLYNRGYNKDYKEQNNAALGLIATLKYTVSKSLAAKSL